MTQRVPPDFAGMTNQVKTTFLPFSLKSQILIPYLKSMKPLFPKIFFPVITLVNLAFILTFFGGIFFTEYLPRTIFFSDYLRYYLYGSPVVMAIFLFFYYKYRDTELFRFQAFVFHLNFLLLSLSIMLLIVVVLMKQFVVVDVE